jgi:hypothetical protein
VNDTSCFSANPTGEGTFECQVLREDRIAVAAAIYYMYSGEHSILQTVDTLPGLAAALDVSGEMRLLSQNESLAKRMWLAKSNIRSPSAFRLASRVSGLHALEPSSFLRMLQTGVLTFWNVLRSIRRSAYGSD